MIQAVRDLQRRREISKVVVKHGFGELLDRTRLWETLGRREVSERPSPAELRATSAVEPATAIIARAKPGQFDGKW